MSSIGRNPSLRHYRFGAALAACLAACMSGAAAEPAKPCQQTALAGGVVSAIIDASSFTLSDGREIRLAGIDAPGTARSVLADLIAGRTVALHGRNDPDRYGRLVAFATVSGSETPVQYALLSAGQARFTGLGEDKDCRAALLDREQAARAARLGLWGEAVYSIRRAEAPASILSGKGRFAVVEGRVLSVRESGATIYVNFGRKWSEDFTVTVARRNERAFQDAGLALKSLAGREVRVRGIVEERGGPWIEAMRPEQIEVVERNAGL
jgi:endonuclease YncB( thermonuclease family)